MAIRLKAAIENLIVPKLRCHDMSDLRLFLKEAANTTARESLIKSRISYDLKLMAALKGYDLRIHTPDVDRDGFDIILDDKDREVKAQLKTVLDDSKTSSWHIHKTMLRPSYEICEALGFEDSPSGAGMQGGIILVKLSPRTDSLGVAYYYTDILVITALYFRIVNKSPKISEKAFYSFYKNIMIGTSHDKIQVPRSFFVKAKTPDHLLGLMGLHSESHVGWFNLIAIAKGQDDPEDPIDVRKEILAEQLINVTDGLERG